MIVSAIHRSPLHYRVCVKQAGTAPKALDKRALHWEFLPDTYLIDLLK
jgi:hypothetical protein